MQIQAYSSKLSFMQICLITSNHLLYLKMMLSVVKYAEMKTKSGSKKKTKKKTSSENIKKFPTPDQFIIKIRDNELLRKTKPIYDNFIKGGHLPHCHDRARTEGLYKGPKFLIPLTGWSDYFT
jgi:hypothetical protein